MSAFQPAQPQRWSLYAGFEAAIADPSAKSELKGWCGLALTSLAIAGVFAFLLVLARVPYTNALFPWPVAFFQKGLIIHVIFSFVIWFLSIFGAILSIASHRIAEGARKGVMLGRLALWASYLSLPLMFGPAFLDRGKASLNNYVPVIVDPVYYAGLAMLAIGLTLSVIRFLSLFPRRTGPMEPITVAAVSGSVIYVLALICFLVSWSKLAGNEVNGDFNESLFWGGGHVLQFLNVSMMLAGWYVLGGMALEQPVTRPQLASLTQALLLAAALLGPLFYVLFDAFSFEQTRAFTYLQYLLAPSSLLAAGFMVKTFAARAGTAPLPRDDAGFKCIWLSFIVFGIGGGLGLFVDGADTRTPAHYHGMIGGATLVFMGLMFRFLLPLMGRAVTLGRAVTTLIHLYAWGQVLFSIGLFVAGGHGTPRKTAGGGHGIEAISAQIGLYVYGFGSLLTVIGGIMFIWIAAEALLRRQ